MKAHADPIPGCWILLILLAGGTLSAQEGEPVDVTETTLRRPKALAALERKGKVIFEDGFESRASLKKWFEITGLDDGRTALVRDARLAHGGRGCLRFIAPDRGGKPAGAGARVWLGKRGYERIHFRRYIRFAADYDQGNLHHTGGGVAGVATNGKWDGMGKAGIKPRGDDRFSSGFEPWRAWGRYPSPGAMMLYTYWMEMKGGPAGKSWGNLLAPKERRRIVPPRDRWVCLEQMIAVNTVGRRDGEMAAWIDGRLYLHMKGIRWRKVPELLVKRAGIGIYVHQSRKANTVWYDDVVISTGYVRPTQEKRRKL